MKGFRPQHGINWLTATVDTTYTTETYGSPMTTYIETHITRGDLPEHWERVKPILIGGEIK